MNKYRWIATLQAAATCLALSAFATDVHAIVVNSNIVYAVTGGDAGDGIDLTGFTPIYGINNGQFESNQTMQGVTFNANTLSNPPNSYYPATNTNDFSGLVDHLNSDVNGSAAFTGSLGASADDVSLNNMIDGVSAGRNIWTAEGLTGNTAYRLYVIMGLGSNHPGASNGYVGDFSIKDGTATAVDAGTEAGYVLVQDNLTVLASTVKALVVDFTLGAGETSFSFAVGYPDATGLIYSGSENENGALPISAWTLGTVTIVPEPAAGSLLLLGAVGLLRLRRRK